MLVVKTVTLLIAGLLSILAVRHVMREMEAVKVRSQRPRQQPGRRIRLRQDPRTGVYYPEE